MRGYEVARQLLEEHRSSVRAMAEELLLHESLDAAEIRALLSGSTVSHVAAMQRLGRLRVVGALSALTTAPSGRPCVASAELTRPRA